MKKILLIFVIFSISNQSFGAGKGFWHKLVSLTSQYGINRTIRDKCASALNNSNSNAIDTLILNPEESRKISKKSLKKILETKLILLGLDEPVVYDILNNFFKNYRIHLVNREDYDFFYSDDLKSYDIPEASYYRDLYKKIHDNPSFVESIKNAYEKSKNLNSPN